MASVTLRNAHKESKREKSERSFARLLLLFFRLSLELGLDFEFGYRVKIYARIRARVRVWLRFRVGIRTRIAIFLFLRNVTAASALFFSASVPRIFLKFCSAP